MSEVPQISIIIAAYNDWNALRDCLQSIADQERPPRFEVLVIDDGSDQLVPETILRESKKLSMRILRQNHVGIADARNRGIQLATGEVLLFTDCDCLLDRKCLKELLETTEKLSKDEYFQLHLTGDIRTAVGRAETLQLLAVQRERLVSSGQVMYLNTSGFAIRRSATASRLRLFDPLARRAEDTLLLSSLMSEGHLPFYVRTATIQHRVGLSLYRYALRGIVIGYQEGYAYARIEENGTNPKIGIRRRLELLVRLFQTSRSSSLGTVAFLTVVVRQILRIFGSSAYRVVK
jgi:glycosyltransferase involved in cell wall biosynthesis